MFWGVGLVWVFSSLYAGFHQLPAPEQAYISFKCERKDVFEGKRYNEKRVLSGLGST